MKSKRALAFTSKGDGSLTIDLELYDVIGSVDFWSGEGTTAKGISDLLKRNPNANTINVRINSEGGVVSEGCAIYNMLSQHPAKVIVDVDALAASIASVIMMAGDERRMAANAMVMIHDPACLTMGTADDLRKTADFLDKNRDNIAQIYADGTGQKLDDVKAAMTAETWMSAEEAKALGYVHSITSNKQITARWDLSDFRNVPTALKQAVPDLSVAAPKTAVNKHESTRRGGAMALSQKDTELAGALLASITDATATSEDQSFKDSITKMGTELQALLGAGAPAAVEQAASARARTAKVLASAAKLAPTGDIESAFAAVTARAEKAEADAVAAAKSGNALAVDVAALTEAQRVRDVKEVLASNRAKCTPALEAWAMSKSVAEVKAVLDAVPAVAAQVREGARPVTDPKEVKLTKEEEELCQTLGTDPVALLAHKKTMAKNPRFAAVDQEEGE